MRITANGIGGTLAAYGLAGLVGTFAGERSCALNVRTTFIVVAALLASAILAVVWIPSAPSLTIVAIVIWGAAFGAVPVCIQAWLYQASPARFEAGSALVVSVFQLALATGAWLGGVLLDRAGQTGPFVLGAAACLLCAMLILAAGREGAPACGEGAALP